MAENWAASWAAQKAAQKVEKKAAWSVMSLVAQMVVPTAENWADK